MGRSKRLHAKNKYEYLHPQEEAEKKPIESRIFMDTATGLILLSQPQTRLKYKDVRKIIDISER